MGQRVSSSMRLHLITRPEPEAKRAKPEEKVGQEECWYSP